jgi:rhodanese-related sulfurtransferase
MSMLPEELAGRIASGRPPAVVDVRTGIEFRRGHIPGALHVPTWKLLLGLARLPADRHSELVVTCELGPRALIVKGLLALIGYRKVTLLTGHMARWRRSAFPLEK